MHFTREPIVETVITAREGAKLLVRNARGAEDADTYLVEAVEVVMFGGAVFYRSASRPSPFLVPVGEYEVVESQTNRSNLKKPVERFSRSNHREVPMQEVVAPSLPSSEKPSSKESIAEIPAKARRGLQTSAIKQEEPPQGTRKKRI
ncbi:hypothetical protein [Candidatus Similichlamydia epinepheli]|uniref:hypothetical protein n=1 Tax=Candidatus Similichlamydia epinepheli TaxID=1903953 RepID=UPI0013006303|nr:hypothetical protein [Candidatus Similichlamydia epinepheli]